MWICQVEEVLDLLNKDMQHKFKVIFDDILKEAMDYIKKDTGVVFDPFIQKYPLEIDFQELERVKKQETGKKELNSLRKKVNAAVELEQLKVMLNLKFH